MSKRSQRNNFFPVIVAIPVCNEEAYLPACLDALAQQEDAAADHILLLVNNTTDQSIAVANRAALPCGTALHIVEHSLLPGLANAGHARHLAMEQAARLAGPESVLLTTDADSRADPDWLAANLSAIAEGADAVAGWVDLDPSDWSRIPMRLHKDDARECAYDALCDEIHALLDPDPFDPWPRHTQNSGASIAVTLAAYRAVGGIPPVASGEDRAFMRALRRADMRIRHSPACHVVVSGRLEGRAAGGMAETIRRRLAEPDLYLDDRLESARTCARRAYLRHRFRAFYNGRARMADLSTELALERNVLEDLVAHRTFGAAWEAVETASPALAKLRVPVDELVVETLAARQILEALREAEHARRTVIEMMMG